MRHPAGLAAGLDDLDVLWVGVRCDPTVTEDREIARGDRVRYDLEVDTTHIEALECARTIAARIG